MLAETYEHESESGRPTNTRINGGAHSGFPAPLDREIGALAIPALGALAADPLVSMVDTAFVGRLGVIPLAALGVNAAIFAMAFVAFNFLAYGTTPIVARAVGQGDRQKAGRIAMEALAVAVIAGSLTTILLLLLTDPILTVMGVGGDLREPAAAYLRIRALAGVAVLIVMASHGIYRGFQNTRTPLMVTLVLNGINLVLDPLFIFGLGWGLEGAAWATVAAQWAGALWFLGLLLFRDREKLAVSLVFPTPKELMPFLRIGGELAVRTFALIGTLALATAVATRLGSIQVAAHQVVIQLWILLALVVDALAVAAQAMVGKYRGSGEGVAARVVSMRLLGWGLGTGLALAVLFQLLSPLLPRIFTTDPEILAEVATILPIVIWMQPLNALVFVWDGIFIGAERFRFLAAQMVVSGLLACLVMVLVVPFGWGLSGVWWAIVVLMVARLVTLALRYRQSGALEVG